MNTEYASVTFVRYYDEILKEQFQCMEQLCEIKLHPFTLSTLRSHNAKFQQRLKEEGAILAEWDDLKDCNACGSCYKCYTNKSNNVKQYKITVSRKSGATIIDHINKKKDEGKKARLPDAVSLIEYRPKKIGGRSTILNDLMISNLIARFPIYLRGTNWKRIYKRNEDGCSLITFYNRVREYEITILVVKDTNGWVFGGFCTEPWK